jgi:hypothetical protein
MKYLEQYIETFGNLNFEEKEFNEIDALIFSQLVYIDFEGIVENEKKIFISDAAMRYYSKHSEEEIGSLISITQKAVHLLRECAKSRRFGEVRLCHYVNNVNVAIDKQFSAINFILPGGRIVVAFRGTDVTVTGVKESAMLSYMFPVPAQIEALYYFQETAMLSTGSITICGHSKGGNLAVFAGVNCSNSLKKRITAVYEFDAPGFPKWFFERYDFQQIKDRLHLITPQSSLIGRMLWHDIDPEIVHSDAGSGLKQHAVSTWEIRGGEFVFDEAYDQSSDLISAYINELPDYIGDDDLELFFNTLEYLFTELGIKDFYDLRGFDIKKAIMLINSLSTLNEEQKERFNKVIKIVATDFAKEYIAAKAKSVFCKKKTDEQ